MQNLGQRSESKIWKATHVKSWIFGKNFSVSHSGQISESVAIVKTYSWCPSGSRYFIL